MGLLVMRVVRPYADYDHPCGHAQYEVIGDVGIAAFMLLTFFEIVSTAVSRLISGEHAINITPVLIIAFSLTIIGNLLVIWYESSGNSIAQPVPDGGRSTYHFRSL